VRGFCHCMPGYYGPGCLHKGDAAREKQLQGPSRTKLKIFIYDLPWEVAFQDGYHPGGGRAALCRVLVGWWGDAGLG
jgi:hypothetical protein